MLALITVQLHCMLLTLYLISLQNSTANYNSISRILQNANRHNLGNPILDHLVGMNGVGLCSEHVHWSVDLYGDVMAGNPRASWPLYVMLRHLVTEMISTVYHCICLKMGLIDFLVIAIDFHNQHPL